jgi:menaquinone-dependent protoporphyrinogen oxidase
MTVPTNHMEVHVMHVVVTAASKHGATREIASWIAEALNGAGVEAALREPGQIETLDGIDAVVIGSGVYAGHWLKEATTFVDHFGPAFATRDVWLFSSGPAGEPLKPEGDPADVEPMRAATHAREHRVFAGRIDRSTMGFAERAIMAALRVPEGDWRPRPAIEAWAREIAATLIARVPAGV